MLEKKFVDVLRAFVQQQNGAWEQTIIRGSTGFRFTLSGSDRFWELELQPSLGLAQGVAIQSQPDFMLRTDDDRIKPLAIFTDGFQFHCHPNNRLADDFQKRRAILESGQYHVWNLIWDDLESAQAAHPMVCYEPVAQRLQQFAAVMKERAMIVPDARLIVRNGLEQLKAFLATPHAPGWAQLATHAAYFPLQLLAAQRTVDAQVLRAALDSWSSGSGLPALPTVDNGQWVYNDKATLNQDVITYITLGDAISNRQNQTIILGRLGDSETECTGSDYNERWRRFLACANLFQFSENFRFWTSSESISGIAPEVPLQATTAISDEWQTVLDTVTPGLRSYIQELAMAGLPVPQAIPQIEYFNDRIEDDAFAELAWPKCSPPIAILAGDQMTFAKNWQEQGWKVITPDDLQAKGISYLIDQLAKCLAGD